MTGSNNNQYIGFFTSERETIDASCPELLNAYRDKAFEDFKEKGFPTYKSEEYKHTDIETLLSSDLGFYLKKEEKYKPEDVFKCSVYNMSSHQHYMVNGWFYETSTSKGLPNGVFSGSLNVFAEKYPELFTKYYNTQAAEKGDGLSSFNTMFVQDGYVLYIPKNIIIENPIQLTNIFNSKVNTLINRRILIVLEEGAQAKILSCDHTNSLDVIAAKTQVTEIFVGKGATFDFYELEESTQKTIRLSSTFVEQGASSNIMFNEITLSNGVTRNNTQIDFRGENAEAHIVGMAIVDKKQRIDNHTTINHHVPHCLSNELFKYVIDEEALGVFSGKILVAPNAQKTQSYQTNRNLLLANESRVYSKPQLEIYADDVKCSHGMTTGQLDENALFYLRSRGINKEEARILMMFAFTDDVIESIRIETLRERLRMLVEKRFRGETIKCQECI